MNLRIAGVGKERVALVGAKESFQITVMPRHFPST